MIRPQHRPLPAVTKHEAPGSGPAGTMGRATPGTNAPPAAESTRTQCVHGVAALAGHSRGIGTRGFPSTDIAQEHGEDNRDSVISSRQRFDFILWETRSKLWRGRK